MKTKMGRDGIMSKKEAAAIDESRSRNWLNPIAMSQLQAAVKARKTHVVLNGVKFTITYDITIYSKVLRDHKECVRLKRTDGGFVPTGTISLKRILDFDFEKGE